MAKSFTKGVIQPLRSSATAFGPSQSRKRFGATVAGTLLALTVAVGWTLHAVKESVSDFWQQNLQTVLNANVQSLEIWLENEKRTVAAFANSSRLRKDVSALVRVAREQGESKDVLLGAEAAASLHEQLGTLSELGDVRGYVVVEPSGLILLGNNPERVAQRVAPPLLAQISPSFGDEVTVVRPYKGLGLLPDIHVSEAIMLVAAPIHSPAGQNVGALVFRIDANADFSNILAVARVGDTGESYAFDSEGFLLTRSRFRDQLIEAGVLADEPEQTVVLRVQARDPGGDLTAGFVPEGPQSTRALTRAAAAAIAGDSGFSLDSYRNYLGIEVIGAWRWLPQYGFGVVTEVHRAQAFRLLRPLALAFLALVVLLLLTTIGLLMGTKMIDRLKTRVAEVTRLGQYEVTDKIGEGGMAVVYRAKHNMLRRPTAVKVLKPEIVNDENLARFEQEVQLTSELTHPNTIEIYDYGRTPDGTFYYAMEYLDGLSLADLILREGAVPAPRVIHILRQICGSLGEAHGIGLVHRDIKPANVVLCERGGVFDTVKVLDFGLVKEIGDASRMDLTAANVVAGTPQYVAPERFKNPTDIDPRSDLYSIGAVGFNLLTGEDVFKASTSMEMCHHVLSTTPPHPSDRNAAVPAELDALIFSCLEKLPEQRPASALDVLSALEHMHSPEDWSRADAEQWWASYRAAS